MTRIRCNILYFILLLLNCTNNSISHFGVGRKSNIANTIVNTLDEISNQNNKLKSLIQTFFQHNEEHVEPEVEEDDCLCTPFYLCDNGQIKKRGEYLLEPRTKPKAINPCKTIGDICCEPYAVAPNKDVGEVIPGDVKCGYGNKIPGKYGNYDILTAEFGEFPWTALILNKKFQYQCVGSLIHPQVILTTAHCVNNSQGYIARVGEWNTTTKTEPIPHQNSHVKFIVKHPKFNQHNLLYNAALLFLEKPFKLELNVNTACLADTSTISLSKVPHFSCFATGWGKNTPTGNYQRVMKKIEFFLISSSLCQSEFRKTRLGKWYELHESFICAVGKNGTDVCAGDGGGPLVCGISGQPQRYQQVGITSWGIGCGKSLPSVFTKVSFIKNWIDNELNARNLNSNYYLFS